MLFVAILVLCALRVSAEDGNRAEQFAAENEKFTWNLYREIAKSQTGSFVVSPLSVQLALALAAVGARGETADELASTLGLPRDGGELKETFGEVTAYLNKSRTLVGANKVYTGFELDNGYKTSLEDFFRSESERVNFRDPQTVDKINSWVSERTAGKIRDLLKPTANGLKNDTRMLLINTLYFKGFWEKAFNADDTRTLPFFSGGTVETKVEMMELTSKFKYAYSDKLNAQVLEMFYKGHGGDISMTVVLPGESLALVEGGLEEVFGPQSYYNAKVHVQLPKFATKSDIKLTEVLKNMGIKSAFGNSAQFTGIAAARDERIKIDEVLQKALLEVDEEGTTAVAATGGFMVMVPSPPEVLIDFIANRPFVYLLKSKSIGVLFIGRYFGP